VLLKEKGKDHRIVFSNIGSFEEKERERERERERCAGTFSPPFREHSRHFWDI